MFKNMKIGRKMALGFMVVIALAIGLGSLAITKMKNVRVQANELVNKEVPALTASSNIQQATQQTMYAIRKYSFTRDSKDLEEGQKHLGLANEHLDNAQQLASVQDMESLSKSVQQARSGIDAYAALLDETVKANETIDADIELMNKSAAEFMENCEQYWSSQNEAFERELSAGDTSRDKLAQRHGKIVAIANIINQANACRLGNWKAQAMRQPGMIEQILPQLDMIEDKVADIRKVTYQEVNLKQLDVILTSNHNYKKAMVSTRDNWLVLDKLNDQRNTAGQEASKTVEATAAQGLKATEAASNNTVNILSAASRTLIIGLMVVFVLGLGIAWLITRGIVNPIKGMMEKLQQGEGDLTLRLDVNSRDEIGELAAWFNTFVAKVQGIIRQVAEAAEEVASASNQIASASEEMAAGMIRQTEQTTQVSAAIEEMSATVIEVARKSTDAAQNANTASSQASEGGSVVGKTIDGIREISRVVSESATNITQLGRQSEQIGEIVAVINDIADQTNLLALNAAIEAARAGEHGRGFAVVADEVRKLAERTSQATQQVTDSVRTIQSGTGSAVEKMNTGTHKVGEGVSLAEQAGVALQAIVENADNVTTMIQSIAAATEEQSASAEQISRNIEAIASISQQSSEGASQAAAAASQLSIKSEDLQKIVGQFKF